MVKCTVIMTSPYPGEIRTLIFYSHTLWIKVLKRVCLSFMVWVFLFVCLDWLTWKITSTLRPPFCQLSVHLWVKFNNNKNLWKKPSRRIQHCVCYPSVFSEDRKYKDISEFSSECLCYASHLRFLEKENPAAFKSKYYRIHCLWNNSCGSKLITLRYQKDLEFTSNFRCFSCISRGGSWEWSYGKLLICHYIVTMWVLICQRNSIVNIWSVGTSCRLSIDDACYSFVLVVPVFIPCTLHLDAFRLIVGKVLSLEDIPHHWGPVAVSGVLHLLFLRPSHHK